PLRVSLSPFTSSPSLSPIMVSQVNESQLLSLLQSSGLVVVDFFANWCGPCKMMSPKFQKLTLDFPNVKFAKVDIDEEENLASKYAINLMPTFVFFRDGKEIHRVEGTKEDDLRSHISLLQ
ncbi:trx-1, partial [Pristionchus pacificus]